MSASVGRSSLLVALFVLSVGACNGNGAPVGNRGGTGPVTTDFNSPPSTAPSTGGGAVLNNTGLQANDSTLNAVVERMNVTRSQLGLAALSRDQAFSMCAMDMAAVYANGGQPATTCGASQMSAFRLLGGGDPTTNALNAIDQIAQQGAPPSGQTNDYSQLTNPQLNVVGIGIVTNIQTFMVILYR